MKLNKTTLLTFISFMVFIGNPVIDRPSDAAKASEVKNPDTFVETTRNSIETLDLNFMVSTATTCIAYNVYDALLSNKPGRGVEPSLATVVPTIENNLIKIQENGDTTITFPIRGGVKFHNGALLRPEDVKYTMTRGIIVGAESTLCMPLTGEGTFNKLVEKVGLEKAYNIIDEAITVEGDNVTFHLKKTFSPFLDIIADNGRAFGIMNKAWCVEQGAWPGTFESVKDHISLTADKNVLHDKMMGTGPFKLQSWEKGERLILERFDDYWQGPAKISRVVRWVITDDAVALQYLQKGDVDFAALSLTDIQQVDGYPGITVIKDIPSSQLIKMNFNFDIQRDKYLGSGELGDDGTPSDFFNDLDVRKGFSYAFDYQTFIDDVLLGAGRKPYGPVLIGFPTANPDNLQYSFDLEKAKEHLKRARNGEVWEKGFKLTVPYSAGSTHRQRALEILQANLKKINPKFKLVLTSLPWAAYVGSINDSEMPISIFGILPSYRHPYAALSYHMHSGDFYATKMGYSALAQEKYDPLLKEMTATFDDLQVKELSYKLQSLSSEDALAIFHYQVLGQVAMRDWIKGYTVQPFPFLVDYYQIAK
jgi:peptide/nickel transport system substrate-binding protein